MTRKSLSTLQEAAVGQSCGKRGGTGISGVEFQSLVSCRTRHTLFDLLTLGYLQEKKQTEERERAAL